MKEQYKKDTFGVVHQLNPEPFNYTQEYQDAYKSLNEEGMSHLRLGLIVGCLGRIPQSLLDVGPGSGHFATTASKIIPRVKIADAITRTDINLPQVENPFDEHVEVMTMFDVVEHIEDLSFLSDLKARYLVLSVPCYPGEEKFPEWKHRKPNEHLHHFNEQSLKLFMADKGWMYFGVTNIEDMIRISNENKPNIITAIFYKR